MQSSSIEALHRGKTGKVSDKWSSYLPYYDRLFLPLRAQALALLEIGIQNGGSLETWAEYFPAARALIGCDINPKCAELRYADPRIQVVVGDANSAPAFERILGLSAQFDVIIDDGSHVSNDIINAFLNYFPHLAPGGLYVIEDTHCLYMNAYGGGLLNDFAAHAFFKRLSDLPSFEFWQDQTTIGSWLRTFFDLRATPAFLTEGWIESIEFRNSIITIRKSEQAGHAKRGELLRVGTVALVETFGRSDLGG